MGDVADDGDGLAGERTEALAQGERVEQGLGRVLVEAVAGVDHRRLDHPCHRPRSPGARMPDDQHVGADRLQVADGIGERLALRDAGGVLLEAEHVGAEGVRGHLERAARPGARLEEQRHHRAAREEVPPGRRPFPRPLRRALVLEAGGEREKGLDLIRPQAFDVQ